MSVEDGLPIVRVTPCRVGAHAFVWGSVGQRGDTRPPWPIGCACGLLGMDTSGVVTEIAPQKEA